MNIMPTLDAEYYKVYKPMKGPSSKHMTLPGEQILGNTKCSNEESYIWEER
jgi:hypothetical protein